MASPVGIRALRAWRKAFGLVVAECRDATHLSQEDLAAETGLDRKFISSLENGHQPPGLNAIIKIAIATRVSPKEMFGRAEQLAATDPIVTSFAQRAAGKTSQGTLLCAGCNAVYERYTLSHETQKPGKSRCRFCKEPLEPWDPSGPFTIYEARRLPATSRRAK